MLLIATSTIVLIAVIAVAVLAIVALVVALGKSYNAMFKLKKLVDNAWSQIDIQLQKRYDLLPNFVNTVKAALKHENETLTEIAQWISKGRDAVTREDAIAADSKVSGLCSKMFQAISTFPELQGNTQISKLQTQLETMENQIARCRSVYTDTVTKYNYAIGKFPANLISKKFGFKEAVEYQVDEPVRYAPKVDLV